jgi:hyaluronoglucosaminidase
VSFAVRGIIEGFYDRLWTWPERRRVAQEVGRLGFDTYVYAPKEDRLQNAGWRTPYSDGQRRQLARFAELCRASGMEPWFGLRPVDISYADERDLELGVAKLRDYVALGAARVLLLADDIPSLLDPARAGRFTGLAEAHAWLVGEVRRALPGVGLAFCPTDYHGAGSDYLRPLGARLAADIELCWTGPEVCSSAIGVQEVRQIATALGRPPLVWDNYPVNDAQMMGDLHIGPIRDRAPDLDRYVSGILVNAALEPEAGLIALATWAEYLRDPAGYDPRAAWQRALLEVTGNAADAAAVAALAAQRDRSVIAQPWRRAQNEPLTDLARRAASLANRRLALDLRRFVEAPPTPSLGQ